MKTEIKTKTFADISKDIQKKYKDRYDPITLKGLNNEMERLRTMQEEIKKQQLPPDQASQTEQFFNGGDLNYPAVGKNKNTGDTVDTSEIGMPAYNFNISDSLRKGLQSWRPEDYTNNFNPNETVAAPATSAPESYGRDPLMYASALGPIAALFMNKRTPNIDRSAAGRFVSTGAAGVGDATARQTEFKEVSMSPIERALAERARGFSGMNAQVSGGNAGQFLANELGNQANILNAQGQASLGQQQMNTQIQGMNAGEQARIDAIKSQDISRRMQAESTNAGLALRYDEIDAQNEGAYRTNKSNAVQSIFQNLGTIGKENTQGNIILKALGYDEMGNYGGKGRSSTALLDMFINNFVKK